MRIERPKAMRLLRLRTLHKIAYKAARLKGAATSYNCVARVAADVHSACSKRAGANLKITADLPVVRGWGGGGGGGVGGGGGGGGGRAPPRPRPPRRGATARPHTTP